MELKDFGLNLAKIRINANMSAYELSLSIGKDASYIHKLENGKVNATLQTIFKVCKILNIKPADLFKSE